MMNASTDSSGTGITEQESMVTLYNIKGASTHRRRGEGIQLSYIPYRGRNAGGY